MVGTEEGVLVWPSRPPAELVDRLRELKQYSSFENVPLSLLGELSDALMPDQVLARWVRRGFVGREVIYSIEYRNSAVVASEEHRRNPFAYDARLVKFYSPEELKSFSSP